MAYKFKIPNSTQIPWTSDQEPGKVKGAKGQII